MLPNQEKAFWEFYNKARHNDVIDDKTSLMIHLAAAMAVGCYPCMRHYLMQQKTVGLTDNEIHAIESIVMAVSAGRVMMQHAEARDRDERTNRDRCAGPC
jgi:alkylhydroperoxidase/carboxymuconolactone decarboxylase family protein YurZ